MVRLDDGRIGCVGFDGVAAPLARADKIAQLSLRNTDSSHPFGGLARIPVWHPIALRRKNSAGGNHLCSRVSPLGAGPGFVWWAGAISTEAIGWSDRASAAVAHVLA